MNYSEKLKDPRWQKKRLEILQRDNFTCQLCDDKITTLHVHHKEYYKNPWEAKDEMLITYCEHCHLFVEYFKTLKIQIPAKALKFGSRKDNHFTIVVYIENVVEMYTIQNKNIEPLSFFTKEVILSIEKFINE